MLDETKSGGYREFQEKKKKQAIKVQRLVAPKSLRVAVFRRKRYMLIFNT